MSPSDDPFVRQELAETLYHVLWELCHVFFEHLGSRDASRHGRVELPLPVPGRDRERPRAASWTTCAASVLMKADEVAALREQTLTEGREELAAAAAALRARLDAGGTLLALGNGGSATDAMDVVADFRAAAARLARAPGDRPHRGHGDHHRGRERHRRRRRSSSAR